MSAILVLANLSASTAFAFVPPVSVATDAPGALAYFDLARKDCIGTARNATSQVWFTLADGVLSDVYYPTLDNTNVKTLEYIVTDGKTFTDLQTRDTTFVVHPLDKHTPDCRVETTAKNGKYRITTDYITDPAHNTVVAYVQFVPLVGTLTDYQLYLRYDPTINGNGGGSPNGGGDDGSVDTSTANALPVACDTHTQSNAANRTYAERVCSALAASFPFLASSNGFVGNSSDGLTQLDATHALTDRYTYAYNGNVVQTAQIDLAQGGNFTFALGFGKNAVEATSAAQDSLGFAFTQIRENYAADWEKYDAGLVAPPATFENVAAAQWQALVDQYYASVNLIKASEDKTFSGALVASMSTPWGQAVSAGDANNLFVGSYREVFGRDAYHAALALYLAGDVETARAVVRFLFEKQQLADGSFPRNSLLNGQLAPDSAGTQLDEVSYPILMAHQLGMTEAALYQDHIRPAANFLIAHGPAFGVERWEEQTGYSPSTLAAEIAALAAAAEIAETLGDTSSAAVWRGVADEWQRSIVGWTVTTNGPLALHPYFLRLSKTGDPNAPIAYDLKNGGATVDQRSVIDAGFLELVRFGIYAADDPLITQSMSVGDAALKRNTSSGAGWYRYNGDGYGDSTVNGHPWTPDKGGNGHLWSLVTVERGEYALAAGDKATALNSLFTLQQSAWGLGLIPEQIWELPDLASSSFGTEPTQASIGFRNGQAAGSASPFVWAAGAYVRLFHELVTNQLPQQSFPAYNRYVSHAQAQTGLTANISFALVSAGGALVKIRGTSVPGSTIYVAATNSAHNSETMIRTTRTNSAGGFNLLLYVSSRATVLNIVAVNAEGATMQVQQELVIHTQ